MSAGFNTEANLEVGLQYPTFVEGFSADLTLSPPTLQSTLSLEQASVTVTVNTTIYWQMGVNEANTIGMYATFMTPIAANYTYTEIVSGGSSPTCTSGEGLQLASSIQGFTGFLCAYPFTSPLEDLNFSPESLTSSSGAACLTEPPTPIPSPKPTTVPSPQPTPIPSSEPTSIPSPGPTKTPSTKPTASPSSMPGERYDNLIVRYFSVAFNRSASPPCC